MSIKSGFTLAEVLIALALLGVIGAFSMPKILLVQQNQQRNAVLQETLASVSQILYEGVLTQQLDHTNMEAYMAPRFNFVKFAPSNCISSGIMAAGSPNPTEDTWLSSVNWGGGILPNGAAICGFIAFDCPGCVGGNGTDGIYGQDFFIDWNGNSPPNHVGEDRLVIRLSYGTTPIPAQGTAPPIPPGTYVPQGGQPIANTNLYQSIISQ